MGFMPRGILYWERVSAKRTLPRRVEAIGGSMSAECHIYLRADELIPA